MATKKSAHTAKKTSQPAKKRKATAKQSARKRKVGRDDFSDSGIVIVDDSMEVDHEKINEERRAYLEEARSQEAFD